MKRRKRPNQAGALETFDPLPWFVAISNALETERHPKFQIAFREVQKGIQRFSGKFPCGFPLDRVPDSHKYDLMRLLLSLMQVGVAPPGWPRFERGSPADFALVEIELTSIEEEDL
jgi:hypothetical protein